VHFILSKPVLSDHLPYVTIFHCFLGKSHKTGLIVCLTEFFIHLEMIVSRQWLRPVFLKCMFEVQILKICYFYFYCHRYLLSRSLTFIKNRNIAM